jgi:peptidoglycan/xylan/chitin deacetylase (PgdA/CDA1 family)
MRIPGRKALRSGWRWSRSRGGARAAILGYHRIADDGWDPFDLCLRPAWFAEQLEVLRERALPLGLGDLGTALADGELPSGAVVVTFDDGYLNNLEVVKPLLECYEVPATLFVVSDSRGREFWWDELARLLEPERPLPPRLELRLRGETLEWETGGEPARRGLAVELGRRLMHLPATDVRAALDALWSRVDDAGEEGPRHRCMTDDELRQATSGGLIALGSHTRSHPPLAGRPEAEQRSEVEGSRSSLEQATRCTVDTFSYPNGSRDDATRRLVREAGYRCACTSEPDVVRAATDPFDLPRFWLPPCDGRRLGRWLDRWVA